MKNITGVLITIVIILVAVGAVLYYKDKEVTDSEENTETAALYVSITDATADIENVNEVNLEVKKVEIYNASSGWTTVSSVDKTYALLALKAEGKSKLYGKKDVLVGSYSKVRMTLGDVTVQTKNKGDVKAFTPAKQVTMDSAVNVSSNSDTHVRLDVLADQSLHQATDGKYVFAPVVEAESKSNTSVTVRENDEVTVSGGSIDSSIKVGVDLDGSSKPNFRLDTTAGLSVESVLGIPVKFMLGGKTYIENIEEDDKDSVNQESSVQVDVSGNSSQESNAPSGGTDIKIDGSLKTNVY